MIHATGQVPVAITLKKKKEVVKIIMLQASDLERKIGSKMGQNVKLNHWFIKLSSRKQTTICHWKKEPCMYILSSWSL